jgi:hypothetical protein
MPYTKAELVEQVYLRVSGGKLSTDIKVQRVDIPLYLNAAINYAQTTEIRQRRLENKQLGDILTPNGVDSEFLNTYVVDISYDTVRGFQSVILPARLQSLPSGDGLQMVGLLHAETPFVRMKHQYEDRHIGAVLSQSTRYWYERIGDTEKLFFKNISPTVTKVLIHMVAALSSLNDNDLIGIPDSIIPQVIDLTVQFFLGTRQIPADMLNNNADDSNSNPR